MELHLRATERHLPYEITQCYGVTCHPTQVNTPRLNPDQTGWLVIGLPTRGGWKAKLV